LFCCPAFKKQFTGTATHSRSCLQLIFHILPPTCFASSNLAAPSDIIFIGNSITDGAKWSELFDDPHIKNRVINGDVTTGVMARIDEVISRKRAKIFLIFYLLLFQVIDFSGQRFIIDVSQHIILVFIAF